MRKLFLLIAVGFSLPFAFVNEAKSAEVFFSQVYSGEASGGPYGEETSAIVISGASLVAGTNFSFVSYDPNAVVFNGNNVVGYLKYVNPSGQTVKILVNASRPVKGGGNDQGLYMAVITVDANGNAIDVNGNIIPDPPNTQNALQYNGEAYVYVLFGQETYFATNTNIGTSSDRVDNFLNGLLSQPKIIVDGTFTAFTSCAGSPSAAQTSTVSGQNLTSGITVTAPSGYEVSLS